MPELKDNAVPSGILVVDDDNGRGASIGATLRSRFGSLVRVTDDISSVRIGDPAGLVVASEGVLRRAEFPSRAAALARFGQSPTIVVLNAADDPGTTEWILAGADDVYAPNDPAHAELPGMAVRVMARAERQRRSAEILDAVVGDHAIRALGRKRKLSSLLAFLQAAALADPLTGLANRRALDARLEVMHADATRDGSDLAVVMMDIDDFKSINDAHGHAKGDELLIRLATILRSQCRRGDLAARYGGDEVVVLLPRAGAAQAQSVAERIRVEFAALAGSPEGAGLSIGIASRAATSATSGRQLLDHADQALYEAKRAGKACSRVWSCARVGGTSKVAAATL